MSTCQRYECKVCQAGPDLHGWVDHGKGCYVISEDGGGSEIVEICQCEMCSPPPDVQSILGMVLADLQQRARLGMARYGKPLTPHDGRDTLKDAYEEALDQCAYLRKALFERDGQ